MPTNDKESEEELLPVVDKGKSSDGLFLVGVAFLPFENFFFAPSAGWAALSPLFFFAYALLQGKSLGVSFKKYFPVFVVVLLCMMVSCFDYLSLGSAYLENVVDTLATVVLGLTCLYSFDIYINVKKRSISNLVKVIVVAYSIAFFVGVVELTAVQLNITSVLSGFDAIMKRNYLPRIQFMFTEPSFTTMHLFGVLLPFYIMTRDKRLMWLIVGFVGVSALSASSLRLLVDVVAVLVIVVVNYADWKKARTYACVFIAPCLLVIAIVACLQFSPRFASFIENGFDSDASYASRMFRIEAVVDGMMENPSRALVGYGAGNAWVAIRAGYDKAVLDYRNTYLGEVIALGDPDNRPTSIFCAYARIASEYGVVMLVIIAGALLRLNVQVGSRDWRLLLLVCAYLYLQFDGYGFYAIWIVIVLSERFKRKECAFRGIGRDGVA